MVLFTCEIHGGRLEWWFQVAEAVDTGVEAGQNFS